MSDLGELAFLEKEKPQRAGNGLSAGAAALFAALLAAGMLLAVQLARQNQGRPLSGAAPDFQLELFDGGAFHLSDYRGQVVLVNFWASWCPPCRAEAPDLQALYTQYRAAGFTLVGVNMLESSRDKATNFIKAFGISYPNGEDRGQSVTRRYRVEGPPESFLIDRRGNIRKFYIGSVHFDLVSGAIEALLAEPA